MPITQLRRFQTRVCKTTDLEFITTKCFYMEILEIVGHRQNLTAYFLQKKKIIIKVFDFMMRLHGK